MREKKADRMAQNAAYRQQKKRSKSKRPKGEVVKGRNGEVGVYHDKGRVNPFKAEGIKHVGNERGPGGKSLPDPNKIHYQTFVNPGLKALKPKGAPSATLKTSTSKPTTLSKPSKELGRKVRAARIDESTYKPVARPAAVTSPKLKMGPAAPKMSSQSSYSSTSSPTSKVKGIKHVGNERGPGGKSIRPAPKAKLKMGSKLSAYASGSSNSNKKTGARLTRRSRR